MLLGVGGWVCVYSSSCNASHLMSVFKMSNHRIWFSYMFILYFQCMGLCDLCILWLHVDMLSCFCNFWVSFILVYFHIILCFLIKMRTEIIVRRSLRPWNFFLRPPPTFLCIFYYYAIAEIQGLLGKLKVLNTCTSTVLRRKWRCQSTYIFFK